MGRVKGLTLRLYSRTMIDVLHKDSMAWRLRSLSTPLFEAVAVCLLVHKDMQRRPVQVNGPA